MSDTLRSQPPSGRGRTNRPAALDYSDLIHAFENDDPAGRDAILDAWSQRVAPIGTAERAALPTAHRRAYEVTEQFYRDLAERLLILDRNVVVQPEIKIEGHGPPGWEDIESFRPVLPEGSRPIYDVGGFTDSVERFMYQAAVEESSGTRGPALDHQEWHGFLASRLLVPNSDPIQVWSITDYFMMHSWATTMLATGSPLKIREIAFDGHATKARITAPIFLTAGELDPEGLELDSYYRLEDDAWIPDDGTSFDHGDDSD